MCDRDVTAAVQHENTPLMKAVESGDVDIVTDLLNAGARVNAQNAVRSSSKMIYRYYLEINQV